jgi:hypothetical protein
MAYFYTILVRVEATNRSHVKPHTKNYIISQPSYQPQILVEKFQPFNNFQCIVLEERRVTGYQRAAPQDHYDPSYIISRSQHHARRRVRTRRMQTAARM